MVSSGVSIEVLESKVSDVSGITRGMALGRGGLRSRARTLALLLAVFVAFALGGAVPSAAFADDLPLILSNDNIGMSGSEIEASQAADVASTAATKAPMVLESPPSVGDTPGATATGSEFVSADGGESPADCTAVHSAAGITSFEHCVETSIRGGVGFDDSSRVCRALFPEHS